MQSQWAVTSLDTKAKATARGKEVVFGESLGEEHRTEVTIMARL